jgi:hypothetical protein
MDLDIGGLTFSDGPGDELPSTPPPELRDEVEAAAGRAEQLAAADRQLHFAIDDASGRVTVQLCDLAGAVIRTLGGSEALDILGGAQH